MATIVLDATSGSTFTPNDGDIYILENDAQGTFTFLGDADFEVQLSDAGPYGQGDFGNSAVSLNFEENTAPTVTVGDNVNAGAVRINGNGDSLDVNVGTGSTTGVIAGDGPNSFGDGLNPDGGGLTVNFADGSTVSNSIFGPTGLAPDGGADANYTFGNDVSFTSAVTVTGSVGGSTDMTVGNNATFSSNAGLVAPAGELNGDTQTITVGDNMTGGGVSVEGSNGEKTMIIGDNADIGSVSFGSYGSNANPIFTADTGGTLIAGDNFNTSGWIYGAQTESTIIIGDGWNTQISLDGQNDDPGLDDPADTVRLGSPEVFFDNSTGAIFGSGNDFLSVRPPAEPPAERAKWIDDATQSGWEENDDGSWSPTVLDGFESTDYATYVYDTSYSGWAGAPPLPDGVVDGENSAELMGEGYDDSEGATDGGGDQIGGADGDNDVILGNGGDDTITAGAGADEVYGGSGDDVIDGGDGNDTLTGGTGDDLLTGGDGNDTFVYTAGDGNDTISDFNTGNTGTLDDGDATNNDFVDLTAFYDNIFELREDFADDGVLNQSNTGVDYSNNTSFGSGSLAFDGASADSSSFTTENTGVVCFVQGTLIATQRGHVCVEDLVPDDTVQTMDNGFQPLRWIGARHLSAPELRANRKWRPIRVSAGAFSTSEQGQDLIVSPQHRILISSKVAQRMFNTTEVLVSAKKLLGVEGVEIANQFKTVSYYHILFDAHQIVFANGVPAESLYLGDEALRSLSPEGREEIAYLFPETLAPEFAAQAARRLVCGKRSSKLVERLTKNNKPLDELNANRVYRARPLNPPC